MLMSIWLIRHVYLTMSMAATASCVPAMPSRFQRISCFVKSNGGLKQGLSVCNENSYVVRLCSAKSLENASRTLFLAGFSSLGNWQCGIVARHLPYIPTARKWIMIFGCRE